VDVAERQSTQLTRLVADILDVERIETGKPHLERRPVDLRAVVAETVEGRCAPI
jgi:signal transduction histidine kinase